MDLIVHNGCFYSGAGEASADVPEGEENKAKNDNPAVEGQQSLFYSYSCNHNYMLKFTMNN